MFHSLSPTAYKNLPAYPVIQYGLAPSTHGDMAIAWWPDAARPDAARPDAARPDAARLPKTGDRICYLALHSDLQKTTDQLHKMFPRNAFARDDIQAAQLIESLDIPNTKSAVLMKGTPFFLKIWETLYNTKPGETMSYGQLATLAGRPKASRAVGQAMATNPVALLVPCHRVLAGTGGLGGYAYGLDVKKRLLAAEKISN